MPSTDHPLLLAIAAGACFALAFPLARFFFDDIESFKSNFGLAREEIAFWLLGFLPTDPMVWVKLIGFVGTLAIVFLAVYALALRLIGAQ